MKKVLIITYYWPPAGGPGVQRWLKFAKYLPQHGIQPVVLTVDSAFATYPIIDNSLEKEVPPEVRVFKTKTKEFFGAYKKATSRNQVPYSGFASEASNPGFVEKIARFVRGNLFFPDPRKGWKKFAVARALELIDSEQIETVITTGPPHSTHLIGEELKKRKKVKWLADFRDPWTDIYYYSDFYPLAITRWLESRMERKVLLNADLITTASPGFSGLLAEKVHDKAKVLTVTNGYDLEGLELEKAENPPNKIVITYTGTLTSKYPLETLITAISQLDITQQSLITLNLVGKLDEASEALLARENLHAEINLAGYVSHSEVMSYLNKSTHVLLLIPIIKGNEGIIPAKLFEYIGSGKSIIGIGPLPSDAASIIQDNNFGRFFTPNQITELKNWLSDSESDGQQPNSHIRQQFHRKHLTSKLAQAIKSKL